MRDVSNYQTENSTLYNKRLYNENSNRAVSLYPIFYVVGVVFDSWGKGWERIQVLRDELKEFENPGFYGTRYFAVGFAPPQPPDNATGKYAGMRLCGYCHNKCGH